MPAPPLTALVAALVAAAVAVAAALFMGPARRRVEGLANPNNVEPKQLENDTNFINKWCGPKGNTYESLVAKRSSLLKRYKAGDVKWQCDHARNQFVVDARDQKRKPDDGDQSKCGNRKVCPDDGLRARRPCMNRDETKCCAVDGNGKVSDCIKRAGQTDNLGKDGEDLKDRCTRGECPDRQLRAKYQCLSQDGKTCCHPVTKQCKALKNTQPPSGGGGEPEGDAVPTRLNTGACPPGTKKSGSRCIVTDRGAYTGWFDRYYVRKRDGACPPGTTADYTWSDGKRDPNRCQMTDYSKYSGWDKRKQKPPAKPADTSKPSGGGGGKQPPANAPPQGNRPTTKYRCYRRSVYQGSVDTWWGGVSDATWACNEWLAGCKTQWGPCVADIVPRAGSKEAMMGCSTAGASDLAVSWHAAKQKCCQGIRGEGCGKEFDKCECCEGPADDRGNCPGKGKTRCDDPNCT